jgi:predicted enzyme related to lactoylglutathione lyase
MTAILVNIDVPDLERASEFYARAFELRVSRRLGSGVVELEGATSPVYLIRAAQGSSPFEGAPTVRRFDRHWTPVHLDFVVEDLASAVERAVLAGARLERPARAARWGEIAVLADPWGNGFCFIEFTGRGYDELVVPAI